MRALVVVLLLVTAAALILVWRKAPRAPQGDPIRTDARARSERDDSAALVGARGMVAARPDDASAGSVDLRTRLRAARRSSDARTQLARLARSDGSVVRELVELLHPRHDGVRDLGLIDRYALLLLYEMLAEIGPAAAGPLIEELEEEDEHLRARAASALGAMRQEGAVAVQALLARLEPGREDGFGQAFMLDALGAIGSPARAAVPAVEGFLRDEREADEARTAAAEAYLSVAGVTPDTLEVCARTLRGESFAVRIAMLAVLRTLGEEAAPLAEELRALVELRREEDLVALDALRTLVATGVRDARTERLLCEIVEEDPADERFQRVAIPALVTLGPEAEDRLFAFAARESDVARLLLAGVLSGPVERGEVRQERLLVLLDELREADLAEERVRAVKLGSALESPASLTVPWLRSWLDDEVAAVRIAAIEGLGGAAGEQAGAVDALLGTLADPVDDVRWTALEALYARTSQGDLSAEMRSRVADAVARFVRVDERKVLHDAHMIAARLLERVAPDRSDEALPVWIALLDHDEHDWRAAKVLARLGSGAKAAIPALLRAIERAPDEERRALFRATLRAVRRQ